MIDYKVVALHPEDGFVDLAEGTFDYCHGFRDCLIGYDDVYREHPNFVEVQEK